MATQMNAVAAQTTAAANSAINAPGTSGASTTSLAVGTGSKALTIQAGKAYVVGQFVQIAASSAPANYMNGQITAYDASSGALTVAVSYAAGSGTFASWNVALSTPVDPSRFLQRSGGTLTGSLSFTATDTAEKSIQFADTGARTVYLYRNSSGYGFYDTGIGSIWNADPATGAFYIRGSLALTPATLTATHITNALGYTPANKAGETFTGGVVAPTITSTGSLGVNGASSFLGQAGFTSGLISAGPIAREANNYLDQDASSMPVWVVKSGSYIRYDRTNDKFLFVINNSVVASINGGGTLTIKGGLVQNGNP